MDRSRRRVALLFGAALVLLAAIWLLRQPPAPPPRAPEAPLPVPVLTAPGTAAPDERAPLPRVTNTQFFATVEVDEDWGTAPLTVKFTGIPSGDQGTPPFTFIWYFGDGSVAANEQNPTHVYATPGSYTASLIIRDATGRTATDYAEIWAEADPGQPTPAQSERFFATVEVDEDWGAAPLTCRFTAVPSGAGGTEPYAYSWNFGDGSPPSTEQNPTHVYTQPGEYAAVLTIRAANGKVATDFAEIWVEAPE